MLGSSGERIGLILVDHGSTRAAANDMLLDVADLFRRVSRESIVEPAHMELASPTIQQAFDACVAQGAEIVIVHPYFLAPGKHSTRDIPRMVREAASQHPGVRYHITQPLGLDEKIAELILQRIGECAQAGFECDYCRGVGCQGLSSAELTAAGAR